MPKVLIVVPCYNEAARLSAPGFAPLWQHALVELLFVDDGSQDDTARVLRSLCETSAGRASHISLAKNQGKGEAVRQGMLHALERAPEVVGYIDADLSTPASEVLRLVDAIQQTRAAAVIASRVVHLGANIRRRPWRHYLGRVFATAASITLGVPVYDTQCGAKLFRVTPTLREALRTPFASRWAFDVELLGRLLAAKQAVDARLIEVPIREWIDAPGSKLGAGSMVRAGLDLVSIGIRLRRQRDRKP